MSGKIFLSGGGNSYDTYKLDDLFLKMTGEKVLYLPVGLKRTFVGYDGCVEWFERMIKSHDLKKKITTWVNLKNKEGLINKNDFDVIYIGGASDTKRLHSIFEKHNIYDSFKKFIFDGGYVYGGSGGATILGKTINYDLLDKGLDLIDNDSANLLMNYSVFTHLSQEKLKKVSKLEFGNLIILSEKGGAVFDVRNKTIEYIGNEKGFVMSENFCEEMKDGDIIKI